MKKLSLGYLSNIQGADSESISTAGWQTLSNCLRHPESRLEELSIGGNFDYDIIADIGSCLHDNKSLKTLSVREWDSTAITSRGWSILTNTLCDKSSIESTFDSNHTLANMPYRAAAPDDLKSSLCLNELVNKSEVARQKILMHHFSGEDPNIEAFASMNMDILPRAMEWIGRNDLGLSLMYQVARGMPSLFELNTKPKSVVGNKRKLSNECG